MERNHGCYFKYFVEYCLPKLHGLINWSKSYIYLDKESR